MLNKFKNIFIYRFLIPAFNGFKVGWWVFKNPNLLNGDNLKMISDLFGLILKVATEQKHRMTHIAHIHPDSGEKNEIVSIWAGSGIGSNPTKRISELISENELLKNELSKYVKADEKSKMDN